MFLRNPDSNQYYLICLDLAATPPDFPPEERHRRALNVVETLSPLVFFEQRQAGQMRKHGPILPQNESPP